MNADDWKSMFSGKGPSENYLNQAKEQDEIILKQTKDIELEE